MSVTEKEIFNQFDTWSKLGNLINKDVKNIVNSFDDDTIVIFTGAGTSGYIGDTLVPILNEGLKKPMFYSYYSTHIVGESNVLINENQKIILVSFGRSGNSPESMQAIKEVEKKCSNVKHIIITCNKDGELAKLENEEIIILPSETNDLGFAMTNSFSSMLITAYLLFNGSIDLEKVIKEGSKLINSFEFEKICSAEFDNIIYLANTSILGATNEFLLKMNELTNGRYSYYNDQILNFRHGPKSVITKPSIIFITKSENEHSNLYEEDLIKELIEDENNPLVVVFGVTKHDVFYNVKLEYLKSIEIILTILPTIQLLAVKMSEKLGINPDNPSPSGSVNRVVQGVKIYN